MNYDAQSDALQVAPEKSQALREQLTLFLAPLLTLLDRSLDARLVRTFRATLEVILLFRSRTQGLLLSELGAYLLSPDKAPAGTKRLSNLLRSDKWKPTLITRFLWQQAQQRLEELEAKQETALLLWDESVIEKPESLKAEGLCAVRSSKAARLKRIKPGYYTPPTGPPVFVPGAPWVCLLLLGSSGPPILAVMEWWSKRGKNPTDARSIQKLLLKKCAKEWGRRVLHIWDRGYCGKPWLEEVQAHSLRFVVRWTKHYKLKDAKGEEKAAWKIVLGKRSWETRELRDTRTQRLIRVGIYACPVRHPALDTPLWLVVARPGQGREPWYLLTSEEVDTAEQAWKVVLFYARRWQIEMAFRFSKSELAMESPRLWTWEGREKLLLMATLAYAFLLTLLHPVMEAMRSWLLRYFCHRTGKRSQETPAPLYRLRAALSRLWMSYPARSSTLSTLNSG